ncbi:C6 zinc finger domain-containing protein [Pseudomassariella vexata]|uniref:C6 zinc finger domain-containing protein n=1 Tax=Pseudomassariella vexata TaxID=1141098 RepID=A0A1Y2DGK2_9PEZI|nr:C6 zinc finger domain-containing protein [Pseudomassariella vexata]ORY58246.1 C6 zinc finger domain-containing protein [Pseudomassariella vexata]
MAEAPSFNRPVPPATRKKFAVPPVKIACLSCRASRTRCNGENPCQSCASRDRPCVYKPSRRGGPRTRKKPRPTVEEDHYQTSATSQDPIAGVPPNPMSVANYIDPGAGLKNLMDPQQNDSDLLFDSLFINGTSMATEPQVIQQPQPMVRTYTSDNSILNAYYIFIHPYFPILPPPRTPLVPDELVPLYQNIPRDVDEPSSPVALAIAAILALIPCPQDSNFLIEESVLFRRKYAQFLAQSAFESIEVESEKPESALEPRKALDDSDDDLTRDPFHADVPVELESVIALDLLSVYEYSQRGNLKKMRSRASAALMTAMNMSLHLHTDEEDRFSEARRRTWWMTYICICQSSIVSNVHPTFEVFASSFTAKVPTIRTDPEAWPIFIKSQQAILTATQFVIELNKAMKSGADMKPIYQRMTELEVILEPLVNNAETWVRDCPLAQPVDSYETVVAHALRCIAKIKVNSARIKVHRYCAFFDLPVFSTKHCDLKPMSGKEKDLPDLRLWTACHGTCGNSPTSSTGQPGKSTSPTLSMRSTPASDGHQPPVAQTPIFPFSSHQSTKICFKSALNIAEAFDALPYPNTSAQMCEPPCYLGIGSNIIAPRTMPSFACCAMQCAYVLLSVYEKTQAMYPAWNGDAEILIKNLLGRLQQGLLSILATLENYATSFEALGGMRDQIRDKVYSSLVFDT